MAVRQEAIHAKKLEQALRSHERFPINLEWMVDVFKYKHISSLTTHLKRHFKMNVHYKRFAQEQNKRVWTYFISVECFIGICEYVRHAARKKIANVWLRKVGIKGSSRRVVRDYEDEFPDVSEEEEEEEMEDEEDDEEEEDPEFEYYEDVPAKRRRVDDDDEYQCEEDDDESEERSYFQEMEDEETYADSETDSSALDYDSSSSSSHADTPPMRHRTASLTVASQQSFHGRQLVSFSTGNPPHYRALLARSSSSSSPSLNSSTNPNSPNNYSSNSSPSSSAPSSPTNSPRAARAHLTNSGSISQNKLVPTPVCAVSSSGLGGSSGSLQSGNTTSNSRSQQNNTSHPTNCNTTATKQPTLVPESSAPLNEAAEISKEQVDWSYLHLRPNPLPLGGGGVYDMPSKYLASLMFGPQYCAYPQLSPYNYMLSANAFFSNYHPLLFQNAMDSQSNFNARCAARHEDAAYAHHGDMDERQFDTNMFLSFPEEHHYQQYQALSSHNP